MSPEKQISPLTTNATPSSECPGVSIASTRRPPVSTAPGHDGDPEPARELVLVLDVIRMAVRAEDVRRREPLALDRLEQRLERRPAVDEHGHAAGLVADDEGVREPARVHRALDDHAQSLRHRARVGETPTVTRPLAVLAAALALSRRPAPAAVRVVAPFPLDRYAGSGAIGLAVPGAGPTVTRESALNTLLTGKVVSSLLGGAPAGTPLIELGAGPPPDTLVVLPPPRREREHAATRSP